MNVDPGFYAGVEWRIELTLIDADGQAVDLQGLTLRCDLYPSAGAPSQFHFLSTNTPVTPDAGYMDLTDADQGVVVLIATATQHALITKGRKLLWHLNDTTEGANPSFSARGTVYIGKSGEQGSQWTVGGVIGPAAGITFSGRGPRGIQGQSMVVKDTLANLNAVGAEYAAGTGARVYDDPGGDAVNGNYTKVGALGVPGSWTRVGALLENEHFLSTLPQTVAVLVRDRLSDDPHARDFGLVSSASNDQATALQTAVNQSAGRRLKLPRGTYLTSVPVVINSPDLTIQGDGGHLGLTQIRGIGTAGEVIRIRHRSIRLKGINVTASDERRASEAVDGHGILYAGDDAPGQASKSRQELDDIYVNKQPGSGIVGIGPMQFFKCGIVTCDENLIHGAIFDDGAYLGYTNRAAPGILVIDIFSASHNGGHALAIGSPGQTVGVFRVDIRQLESDSNAWRAASRFSDHQMYLGIIQTLTRRNSATGDSVFNATTTPSGYPRAAKAQPGAGVNFESGAANISEDGCRYIGLSKSADIRSGAGPIVINGPRMIFASNWLNPQPIAFDIEDGASSVQLNIPFQSADSVTQIVRTRDADTRYTYNNRRFRAIPGWNDGDWEIDAVQVSGIISGGNLTVSRDLIQLFGEGGVADDLVNVFLPDTALGAAMAPAGFRLTLHTVNIAYVITITGTGNVKTPFGLPFAIYQNSAIRLVSNGTSWYIEGVDHVRELGIFQGGLENAHTGTTSVTTLVTAPTLAANTAVGGSLIFGAKGDANNDADAKITRLTLDGIEIFSINANLCTNWEIEASLTSFAFNSHVINQRRIKDGVVTQVRTTSSISLAIDRVPALVAVLGDVADSIHIDRYSLKLAR